MAAKRSTYGAFALSALLAATVAVLAVPDRSHPGKDAAVRAALQEHDRSSDLATMEPAIARAHALTSVTLQGQGTGDSYLALTLDGTPQYEITTMDDGNYAIDLYGTVTAGAASRITGPSSDGITAVQTYLADLEPAFVSRLVISAGTPGEPQVSPTDTGLAVRWVSNADAAVADAAGDTVLQDEVSAELNRAAIALAQYDEAAQRVQDRLSIEQKDLVTTFASTGNAEQVMTDASLAIRRDWETARAAMAETLVAQEQALQGDDQTAADMRIALDEAVQARKMIHAQWALFGQAADATLTHAVAKFHADTTVADSDTTLAALDAALDVQRTQSGLTEPTLNSEVRAIGDTVVAALADTAVTTQTVASSLASAVTMALARTQVDLQRASAIHLADVAEHGEVLTLTNDDVDAFVRSGQSANIITRARPTDIEAVGGNTDFVLPVERTVWGAQAEDGAAGGSAPAPAPAAEAAPAVTTATTIPGVRGADIERSTRMYDPNDPMNQLVDIDFRDMELSNAVAILARKAGVNVVAGPPLTGAITASLHDVPLRKALEILLQLNDLGMIEDDNIIRIVTFEEAIATHRVTHIVYLENAKAADLANTLQGSVAGGLNSDLITVTPNETTNVILIAGPPGRVQELVALAQELDVAEPVLPTFTEALPLNYADPVEILPVIESLLTKEVGTVEADIRSRHIIVNDVPAVIEEVRRLLESVDQPVKQVAIHALVVDVVLRDGSELGTNWNLSLLPDVNARGVTVGDFAGGSIAGNLGNIGTDTLNAGVMTFGLTNKDYNLSATIAAEVASSNAKILANPSIITAENKEANIVIAQEFPYQEFRQGLEGPPVASTEFKDIGITLTVLPRVTHDNHIIVDLEAKQSSISGITDSGIPIEDKRTAQTTLTAADGQSIFIGGLRNISDRLDTSKIPVLGDIPVLNFMFKNTDAEKINTELMIFMTCHVISGELPDLTPSEQEAHDEIGSVPYTPDAQRTMFRNIAKPGEFRDPAWKWRRSK